MSTTLKYVIKYVADMDQAVAFHGRQLGLVLRFQSPGWSEFDTGATTLALHPATTDHAAGSCQLGFAVDDLDAFCQDSSADGVVFSAPPAAVHGQRIARFRDQDGAECTVSGP